MIPNLLNFYILKHINSDHFRPLSTTFDHFRPLSTTEMEMHRKLFKQLGHLTHDALQAKIKAHEAELKLLHKMARAALRREMLAPPPANTCANTCTKTCPKDHTLVCTKGKPEDFLCNEPGTSYSCLRGCNFDVCAACAEVPDGAPVTGGTASDVAPVTDDSSPLSAIDMALAIVGRYSYDVGGDGNCQFRSLAYHLLQDPRMHPEVRARVVTELRTHPERYVDFAEEWDVPGSGDTRHKKTWDEFLKDIASYGVWGGRTTLVAAANAYGRVVNVVSDIPAPAGSIPLDTFRPILKLEGRDILIAYLNGNHYTATKRLE